MRKFYEGGWESLHSKWPSEMQIQILWLLISWQRSGLRWLLLCDYQVLIATPYNIKERMWGQFSVFSLMEFEELKIFLNAKNFGKV
jgi:hypothetical protein